MAKLGLSKKELLIVYRGLALAYLETKDTEYDEEAADFKRLALKAWDLIKAYGWDKEGDIPEIVFGVDKIGRNEENK